MGSFCASIPNVADSFDEYHTTHGSGQNVIVIWDFDKTLSNSSSDYFPFIKCGIVQQFKNKMKEDKSNVMAKAEQEKDPLLHYSFIDTFNQWGFPQLFLPIRDCVSFIFIHFFFVSLFKKIVTPNQQSDKKINGRLKHAYNSH